MDNQPMRDLLWHSRFRWHLPLEQVTGDTKYGTAENIVAIEEAGLRAGDQVVVEALEDGELRVRRSALTFDSAFGALTHTYPPGYLHQLDEDDAER